MAQRENIFIAAPLDVAGLATTLIDGLGLEPIEADGYAQDSTDIGLRGPAHTASGLIGLRVYRNGFADPDAQPQDAQAFDAYPLQIDLWLPGSAESAQQAEGRAVFDAVVKVMRSVPALLTHDLNVLIAAYLPGMGTKDFNPPVMVDMEDHASWGPWTLPSVTG